MVSSKSSSEFRFKENVQKYQDYIGALEEERKKIQVFERQFPLSLELVSQAIERCRQQMTIRVNESFEDKHDDSKTSIECPVLEEFIPMKSTSYTNEHVDDQLQQKQMTICSKDWLASAQLSIQAPNPHPEEKKKTSNGSSSDTDGGRGGGGGRSGGGGEDKGQSNKKERRCWSQELHRLFLNALQQLGGAHVATPKQIREFMKVDGLTNDEIKSHLQKYRLHTRRLNPTVHDTHAPQLMVVGRLWMPPLDYTTSETTSPQSDHDIKNAKAVYAPIASLQYHSQ